MADSIAPAPSLRALERLLFGLIRAADGVKPGLASLGLSEEALGAVVVGDARLSPLGRVGIYADMYFFRLLDVLRGAFPKLRAVLGDDAFTALVTDYLDACPSRHPSLRHLGDRLPEFLRRPEGQRPHVDAETVPVWAADLAALEWARYDVFDDADADLLTLPALQALAPTAFAALTVKLAPAQRRLDLEHGVETVWRAVSTDGDATTEVAADVDAPPAPPAGQPRRLLIWRQGIAVYHRSLEALEAGLLDRAAHEGGVAFGALCEQVAAVDEATAAETAFRLLARWVNDGLLVDALA